MGGVAKAIGSILTGGMLGGQVDSPNVHEANFKPTDSDKQKEDPNRIASMKEASERRRRLAANRGRQNLRVDLAQYGTGAGISIRGRKG